jgi:hypothetical protein
MELPVTGKCTMNGSTAVIFMRATRWNDDAALDTACLRLRLFGWWAAGFVPAVFA